VQFTIEALVTLLFGSGNDLAKLFLMGHGATVTH
jgi:hypothetical protein